MKKTLLLVTQVFVPDPAAVGQHMADAAEAMVRKGWRVIVYTANRGYDNPNEKFPAREVLRGIEVQRIPFSSLGKQTLAHRLAGQLSFCIQSFIRGLFIPGLETLLVTTSPPMGSVVGWAINLFRKVRVVFWVMDINPDQAVKLGKASPKSFTVKLFNWFNRRILAGASEVVVLDRFMEQTIRQKLPQMKARLSVLPPWPMEDVLERIPHESNPFRKEHGLEGKFVVMYSGNHSLVHPLDTVLKAALQLQDEKQLIFMFIGGGKGKEEVERVVKEQNPSNIRCLPYQPLDQIKYSLSAADVHLVSMGNDMIGIVHPCKFYGAMALAKPFILIGPKDCHIGDVLNKHDSGWTVSHGDVDAAVALFKSLVNTPAQVLGQKGESGRNAVDRYLSKETLCGKLTDVIEGHSIS